MPGLFGKAKSLFNDEVEQWKRSFNLLGGIPKTFKNNPRNAETMDAVFGFGGIVPGVGDAASAIEAKYRYDQGDKLGAGLAGIGALPLVPNVAGMFIGKGAKTWDALKHAEALKMEQAGKHPRVIWAETGNWKAPDGMWRQEIPDNAAQHNKEWMWDYYTKPITSAVKHEELFKAYPGLADTKVRLSPQGGWGGSYNPKDNVIEVLSGIKADDAASINIHELQHAIQNNERMATGGSPETMRRILSDDPLMQSAYSQPELYDAYRRLHGEAEARATQARMNMDMPMRLAKFPEDSFDVPMDRLIVRYGDGPAMSTGRPRNHLGQEIPPTKYEQALEEARIDAWKNHGLPENNTAMDRAKAMGHDPNHFHGSLYDIPEFNINRASTESHAGAGVYTTDSPVDASLNYANLFGPDVQGKLERQLEQQLDRGYTPLYDKLKNQDLTVRQQEALAKRFLDADNAGVVYPLSVRSGKVAHLDNPAKDSYVEPGLKWDAESGDETLLPAWSNWEKARSNAENIGADIGNIESGLLDYGYMTDGGKAADIYKHVFKNADNTYNPDTGDLVSNGVVAGEYLKGLGIDTIQHTPKFKNPQLNIGETHSIVFDPSRIRSRFAAFNMSKRDSPDLLAGFAPYAMPVGAGLLGSMFLLPREDMQ